MTYIYSKNRAENHITLRFAYASSTKPLQMAFADFGKRLEEKTKGAISIIYFPDSQLGGERELVELVQTGAVDITKVSGGLLESFAPLYGVFSLPYVFDDENHFYKVMDNLEIMNPVYKSTEPIGFLGLTYYDAGQRSFYTKNKPIIKLEDLKGLKFRVIQSQTAIKMVSLLGGTPVAMSNNETYSAMQQGLIDGAESNEMALTIPRHGEVAKDYSYDMHTRIPDVLIMNAKTLKKLSPEQQKIVHEVAEETKEFQKKLWQEEIEKVKQQAQDEFGVRFHKANVSEFRNAVTPMYEALKEDPKKQESYALFQKVRELSN